MYATKQCTLASAYKLRENRQVYKLRTGIKWCPGPCHSLGSRVSQRNPPSIPHGIREHYFPLSYKYCNDWLHIKEWIDALYHNMLQKGNSLLLQSQDSINVLECSSHGYRMLGLIYITVYKIFKATYLSLDPLFVTIGISLNHHTFWLLLYDLTTNSFSTLSHCSPAIYTRSILWFHLGPISSPVQFQPLSADSLTPFRWLDEYV